VNIYNNGLNLSDGMHNIVIIADSSGVKILIDTEEVMSSTNTCSLYDIEWLNNDKGDNRWPIKLLDQVRIFNRALTADEVNTLYNEYVSKYTIDYNELAAAPAVAKVPSRDTELAEIGRTYDGSKFNVIYSDIEKQGRAIQRKLTAEKKDTEVYSGFATELWVNG